MITPYSRSNDFIKQKTTLGSYQSNFHHLTHEAGQKENREKSKFTHTNVSRKQKIGSEVMDNYQDINGQWTTYHGTRCKLIELDIQELSGRKKLFI